MFVISRQSPAQSTSTQHRPGQANRYPGDSQRLFPRVDIFYVYIYTKEGDE